ncbi:MAG: cofactor-independent phosphoglycerate mutase [Nitrospinota bacterium]|nr:cofactor-independent phosphoglycerate mutase [Nitrospinota bacterium]
MKYIVLLADGMPDYPIEELGNKTPLEAAHTPNMDFMAREGSVGMVNTVPDGMSPGSDVCNLSILGYDPRKYYTGRAPFEAANMGIKLAEGDIPFRCNLVTLGNDRTVMDDFSAGHVSTEDAAGLISFLDERLGNEEFKFYPGKSYRHIMVWKGGNEKLKCTPPHDISGQEIKGYLPQGGRADILNDLMNRSQGIIKEYVGTHNGDLKANSIWLWGQGRVPVMPTMKERFGITGSVIAAVDLMKGIGIFAGLTPIDVPGATGYVDTNYEGKAEYALNELKDKDFVYLHVESPDESGHNGSVELKVRSIEDFDRRVVGNILKGMKVFPEYRILLVSDHRTPIALRTHSAEPVPFAIYPPLEGIEGGECFSERVVEKSKFFVPEGHKLIELLLGN